jgi:hypothetical protein
MSCDKIKSGLGKDRPVLKSALSVETAMNAKGKIIRDYVTPFSEPLAVSMGERLRIGKRDEEWPEFVWCVNQEGKGGWIPEEHIERSEDIGYARRDYTTQELTVRAGETVALFEQDSRWFWAENAAGKKGWIPAKVVRFEPE